MFALFAQPLAQCLTHSRNSVFVNEQMNEWPTSLRKWLTLERGRLPKYPWLFLNPVTFGSTKAVVNVLPCYKMSWVHTIVTVSSACACRNVMCTHTGTWGLELRTGFKWGNERGQLETSIANTSALILSLLPCQHPLHYTHFGFYLIKSHWIVEGADNILVITAFRKLRQDDLQGQSGLYTKRGVERKLVEDSEPRNNSLT